MKEILEEIPFRIHVERRADGRCVVVAAGEADVHAAPELDRCLRQCEGGGKVTQVVVDLTETTLLDSTALGILVAAHSRFAKDKIPLKLACTNRLVRRVLTVTGLDRILPVYASLEEALDGGVRKGGAVLNPASDVTGAASES